MDYFLRAWGISGPTQSPKPYYLTDRVLACVYGACCCCGGSSCAACRPGIATAPRQQF